MNRELKSPSVASESNEDVLVTEGREKPALRDMPALRRILHLIWEVVWPYEIIWNSKPEHNREPQIEKAGENITRNQLRDRGKDPKGRSNSQRVERVIARTS